MGAIRQTIHLLPLGGAVLSSAVVHLLGVVGIATVRPTVPLRESSEAWTALAIPVPPSPLSETKPNPPEPLPRSEEPEVPPEPLPPPPKPDPPIQLGIDDGADKADAWQGFREATPHSGRLSTVEQSNLSTNPGVPSPGGGGKPLPAPAPARAVETGPDERPSGVEDDVPVVPKGEVARIASPAPEVPEPAKPQPLPPAPPREAQSSDPEQTAREQERDSAEQPPRPEDARNSKNRRHHAKRSRCRNPSPLKLRAATRTAPEPVPEVEPEPRPQVKIETPAEKAEEIAPQSPGQALKTTPAASVIEIPEAPENSEELQRVSSPPSPQEFPCLPRPRLFRSQRPRSWKRARGRAGRIGRVARGRRGVGEDLAARAREHGAHVYRPEPGSARAAG